MKRKTIAVDFDGVLHEYNGWNDGKLGKPVKDAVETWWKLYDAGFELIVFTCRADIANVREWMHIHFDFERRLGHFYEPTITNTKPIAIAYIDDRAIRFTNWNDIRKYFC